MAEGPPVVKATRPTSQIAIILVAHGSRLAGAAESLRRLRDAVSAEFGALKVEVAFCELQQPDLPGVIDRCVADGARRVLLYPCFLSAGGHVTRDLPAAVAAARLRHPGLLVQIEPPLGVDPGLAGLVNAGLRRGLERAGWV